MLNKYGLISILPDLMYQIDGFVFLSILEAKPESIILDC